MQRETVIGLMCVSSASVSTLSLKVRVSAGFSKSNLRLFNTTLNEIEDLKHAMVGGILLYYNPSIACVSLNETHSPTHCRRLASKHADNRLYMQLARKKPLYMSFLKSPSRKIIK